MSEQDQIARLQQTNEELVGFIQDYQQRLVEADFATVQANGRARRAEARVAALEEQARIAQEAHEEAQASPKETPKGDPGK